MHTGALKVQDLTARDLLDMSGRHNPGIVGRQHAGEQRRTRQYRPSMVVPTLERDNLQTVGRNRPAAAGFTLWMQCSPFRRPQRRGVNSRIKRPLIRNSKLVWNDTG